MRITMQDNWVFMSQVYRPRISVMNDPVTPKRQLHREADFIFNPDGHLVKNRSTGVIVHYKTTFNWRERFRVFFTGKI